MFPLDVCSIGSLNIAMRSQTLAKLWHIRVEYLNYRSLLSIAQKKLVVGLPKIKQASQCEYCALTKQSRSSFVSGVSRRASNCLQLAHMDLCGQMSEDSLGGNRHFF